MTIEEAIIQLDYLKNSKTDWDIAICMSRRRETLSRQEMIERDMKEIREVMDCDADTEIKWKMIFNILNAKPHYFEKLEPMRNTTFEERESVDVDEEKEDHIKRDI